MLKVIFLLCLCCHGALAQQNQAIPTQIQEALLFSREIEANITEFIYDAVPVAAQPEAQNILNEAMAGVAKCETALQTIDQIWQYKVCSSAQLRNAMLALTKLTADTYSHASNGGACMCWSSAAMLSLIMLKMLH